MSEKQNLFFDIDGSNGTYAIRMLYHTGSRSTPKSVSIGDVNNDNQPDIVFANQLEDSVGILINQRNGTFIHHSNYSTGSNSHPQYVSVVDVNNDEQLDLVVANPGRNSFGVFPQ